jgi:hypothetical protein
MFHRAPLEERIAQRQAELNSVRADAGQFDHPTAKYLFYALLVLTVLGHVVGGIVFAIIGF